MAFEGASPHYQIVVTREAALDQMEVRVEVSERMFFDEMKKLRAMTQDLEHRLERSLGVHVGVKLVEPGTIERSEGKARRVVDLRKFD